MPTVNHTSSVNEGIPQNSSVGFDRLADDTLRIRLKGNWVIGQPLSSAKDVQNRIQSEHQIRRLTFDAQALTAWDSALLTFLLKINEYCAKSNIVFEKDELPHGAKRLIDLATAVPERKGARKTAVREPFFHRVGTSSLELWHSTTDLLAFIGEAFVVFL